MATENSRTFAPGVRVTEYWHADEYFGSAEALVSAGLVRANQLPGQPGVAKSCVTFYGGKRVAPGKHSKNDEKFLRIKTAGKKFNLKQGISKEVEAERRSAKDAKWEAEREVERVAATTRAAAERAIALNKMIAEGTLDLMPTSPNEYRQKLIADWDGHAHTVRGRMLPSKGNGFDLSSMEANGFALDESVITEFNGLVNDARLADPASSPVLSILEAIRSTKVGQIPLAFHASGNGLYAPTFAVASEQRTEPVVPAIR